MEMLLGFLMVLILLQLSRMAIRIDGLIIWLLRLHTDDARLLRMVDKIERRRAPDGSRCTAMEVHVLPFRVAFVPDTRLLRLMRVRITGPVFHVCVCVWFGEMISCGSSVCIPNVVYELVDELRQPDVRNACGIVAEQMHVRIQNRRIDCLAVFAEHCEITEQSTGRMV